MMTTLLRVASLLGAAGGRVRLLSYTHPSPPPSSMLLAVCPLLVWIPSSGFNLRKAGGIEVNPECEWDPQGQVKKIVRTFHSPRFERNKCAWPARPRLDLNLTQLSNRHEQEQEKAQNFFISYQEQMLCTSCIARGVWISLTDDRHLENCMTACGLHQWVMIAK